MSSSTKKGLKLSNLAEAYKDIFPKNYILSRSTWFFDELTPLQKSRLVRPLELDDSELKLKPRERRLQLYAIVYEPLELELE
jgi:hypothetical protein